MVIIITGELIKVESVDICEVKGIKIGHYENLDAATGCTVIICDEGATAGVDVRGGAPGTRETDLLNPVNLVDKIHAVILAGGSAFGLDAATGIMGYLEENGKGFDVGVTKVPIVCGAVLFDLLIGNYKIRPDKKWGYSASVNASENENRQGNVGAGAGATVGKFFGMSRAVKGGLGTACLKSGKLTVAAVIAVNCYGSVVDPESGKIIGGPLNEKESGFLDTGELIINSNETVHNAFRENTTIGAVLTNATLTKSQANKLASVAQNGLARTIIPAHSMFDGDTIFTMATGECDSDLNTVGLLATKTVEKAVTNAIKKAAPLHGIRAYSDFFHC